MPPRSSPAGGGILIALGAVLGVVIGLSQGQVVPGFLLGILTGAAGALILWWISRSR